jgi:hypothetical protein
MRGERSLLSWEEIEACAVGSSSSKVTRCSTRASTGPSLAGFVTPAEPGGLRRFRSTARPRRRRDLSGGRSLSARRCSNRRRGLGRVRFFETDECGARASRPSPTRAARRSSIGPAGRARCARSPAAPREGRLESSDEQAAAIRRELAEARRLIEERTGRRVVHLCYPWHVAGALARRLAEETGYETAFCGKVDGVPLTRPGGDLRQIAGSARITWSCSPARAAPA